MSNHVHVHCSRNPQIIIIIGLLQIFRADIQRWEFICTGSRHPGAKSHQEQTSHQITDFFHQQITPQEQGQPGQVEQIQTRGIRHHLRKFYLITLFKSNIAQVQTPLEANLIFLPFSRSQDIAQWRMQSWSLGRSSHPLGADTCVYDLADTLFRIRAITRGIWHPP